MDYKSSGKAGVNILDPQELLSLAEDNTESGRAILTEAVSDFFRANELTEHQRYLAQDILINLLQQAEFDLRQAMAERLSTHDNVPRDLILYLAQEPIDVAEKVLLHNPLLHEMDLIRLIDETSDAHWQAISRRETLTPKVADRLIDTRDASTILGLLENERLELKKSSVKKIVKAAITSEELHVPLLRRPEVDKDTAMNLYILVSEELRQNISERFSLDPQYIERSFEILVQELSNEARGQSHVTPEMVTLAEKFSARGDISNDLIIKTLRRGQFGFFVALFAQMIDFSSDAVLKMVRNNNGKGFIVACRHLNMMKSEFASIYLLSRGVRKGDKIVDQRELAMALKKFDALHPADVENIMRSWSKNPELI